MPTSLLLRRRLFVEQHRHPGQVVFVLAHDFTPIRLQIACQMASISARASAACRLSELSGPDFPTVSAEAYASRDRSCSSSTSPFACSALRAEAVNFSHCGEICVRMNANGLDNRLQA